MSLGGLFRKIKPEDTLIGRLRVVDQDLMNIADVKDMTKSRGWIKVRKALEDEIRQCEISRYELDADPAKHHVELIRLREFERALSLILSTVDGAISSEHQLLKLKREYEQLAEKADLDKRFSVGGGQSS